MIKNYLLKSALLGALIIAGCDSKKSENILEITKPSNAAGFQFIVIGDTPYSDADRKMLESAVPKIREFGAPFVVHIGDYKGGRPPCLDKHDDFHAKLIADLAPIPVFYTPGDNEWTDCDRHKNPATGVLFSDLDRLEVIRKNFFANPPNNVSALNYSRQDKQVENQSWEYQGVRFLTLHVTGTNNGRDWVTGDPFDRALFAVTQRDIANRNFLDTGFKLAASSDAKAVVIAMQADMTDIRNKPVDVMCQSVAANDKHDCDGFTDLRAHIQTRAIEFTKPVLLIHGDTAPFTLGQKFAGEEADNLWRLNAAGDKGPNYGVRDVTLVTIDVESDTPFSAEGLTTGIRTKPQK